MKNIFVFAIGLFSSMLVISSCNNQEKKQHLSALTSVIPDDTTTIFNNENLNKQIQDFAHKVALEDSISLFAIYVERKPASARVTVIPLRTIRDTLQFPCPTAIKLWDNKRFLLYNGMELLSPVTTSTREKYNTILKTNSNPVRGLYDGPMLQFEVFSSSNIHQVIPPENPDEKKEMIPFAPPSKK